MPKNRWKPLKTKKFRRLRRFRLGGNFPPYSKNGGKSVILSGKFPPILGYAISNIQNLNILKNPKTLNTVLLKIDQKQLLLLTCHIFLCLFSPKFHFNLMVFSYPWGRKKTIRLGPTLDVAEMLKIMSNKCLNTIMEIKFDIRLNYGTSI